MVGHATLQPGAGGMGGSGGMGGAGGSAGSTGGGAAGLTWTSESLGLEDLVIWGSGPTDVWIAGNDGYAMHGSAGNWRTHYVTSTAAIESIWGSGPNDVYFAADTRVFHYANGAFTQVQQPAQTVWGTGANDVYLASASGVLHSTDGGASWSSSQVGGPAGQAIWGASATELFIGSSWQAPPPVVYHTRDGGATYTTMTLPNPASNFVLTRLWGSGPTDVWASGWYGAVYHSSDGNTFDLVIPSSLSGGDGTALWGSGPNDVYIGIGTQLLHTVDHGATFSAMNVNFRPTGIWGSAADDVYVIGPGFTGNGGYLLHGHR